MRRSRLIGVVGMLASLALSGYGAEVTAQAGLQIGGNRANFGRRTLRPGFVPDPTNIHIVSGGNINAATLNLGSGCVGYVTTQPDFILTLRGTSPNLRFYVTAGSDTTLLVNTARGGWRCNDDSYGGRNPTVDLANAPPGQYDVWVGSYRAGEQARGQLHITELDSNHP